MKSKFSQFAESIGIDLDVAQHHIIDLVVFACTGMDADKRLRCVREFLDLSSALKSNLFGSSPYDNRERYIWEKIRDLSEQLNIKIEEMRELDLQNERCPDLDCWASDHYWVIPALADAATRRVGEGEKKGRALKKCAAKAFVVLCHKFGIHLTWSKDIDSCSPHSSVHLLAAIFDAAGLEVTDTDRGALGSANYYLGMLSKGFMWQFEVVPDHYEDGWVLFDRVIYESSNSIGSLPRFAP